MKVSDMMRAIRPFVGFNYSLKDIKAGKLNKKDEDKIKKYYEAINLATAQPVYQYKPRSNKNKKAALEYANQPNLKELNTVFIPVPQDGMKPDISFTKSGMKIKTGYVETRHVSFNKKKLAEDSEKEVKRALSKFPKNVKRYNIQCGQFEMRVSLDANTLPGEVNRLMEKYSKPDNHYYGNWLNGVFGYTFLNQADDKAYFAAKGRAKNNKQKARRNAKRRGTKNII